MNNLPKLFKETIRCLKNDSAFIGALFAGDTLFELRVSLQLAELERRGVINCSLKDENIFMLNSQLKGHYI